MKLEFSLIDYQEFDILYYKLSVFNAFANTLTDKNYQLTFF